MNVIRFDELRLSYHAFFLEGNGDRTRELRLMERYSGQGGFAYATVSGRPLEQTELEFFGSG